jgi:hypothetical protein
VDAGSRIAFVGGDGIDVIEGSQVITLLPLPAGSTAGPIACLCTRHSSLYQRTGAHRRAPRRCDCSTGRSS